MASAKQLRAQEDLEQTLKESEEHPVLIFKHSTTCPISAAAHRQWSAFLASPEAEQVGHAWVRVIEERPLSLALAAQLGVEHQSPQAIVVRNRRAVWHTSHHAITAEALRQAVAAS